MANQTLGQNEVLNVKWAYDDPNPVAQEAMRRADADAALAALKARGMMIQSEEDGGKKGDDDEYPIDGVKDSGMERGGEEPKAKKPRTEAIS